MLNRVSHKLCSISFWKLGELCETFIRQPCIIENWHYMRFQETEICEHLGEVYTLVCKVQTNFQQCVRRFFTARQAKGNLSPQWASLKQHTNKLLYFFGHLLWRKGFKHSYQAVFLQNDRNGSPEVC